MNMYQNLYDLDSYSFSLPEELIAQHPIEPRDNARLMICNRTSKTISEAVFSDCPRFFNKGDILVANESRVIPARLFAKRSTGAKIEVLLIEQQERGVWKAFVRPSSKVHISESLFFEDGFTAKVVAECSEGKKLLLFENDAQETMHRYGHIPLPPYIRKGKDCIEDRKDYQTVFAKEEGSIAAPTAGLHFTKELIDTIKKSGIQWCTTTLHVGIGTFQPVREKDIRNHVMHSEKYTITQDVVDSIEKKEEKARVIAVGTTALRTLEASYHSNGLLIAGSSSTDIFIYPGYQFQIVDALITNFHLPESSLLMLVAAFMGLDFMKEAYEKAIKEHFRFFSYGDAMLVI